MFEFLDFAYRLIRSHPSAISRKDFDLVFTLINERLPELHAKSVVDLDNIESVFGLIEMGRLIGKLPRTSSDEIEAASRAMRRVLAQTVEHYCQFPFDGQQIVPAPEYDVLAHLAAKDETGRMRGDFAFVTFNYDIALDFALHWRGVDYSYGLEEPASGQVPLLKLHGSLNWGGCSACGVVRPYLLDRWFRERSFNRGQKGKRSLPLSRCLEELGPHCEGSESPAEPAIVPPSWNKTQYHNLFSRVWRRAAEELSEAEEIVVAGYSMPDTDQFFRDLLALGLVGSSRLQSFTVVNPDQRVSERFHELLGPATKTRYRNVSSTFAEWAPLYASAISKRRDI
jgi:hypothetical protein